MRKPVALGRLVSVSSDGANSEPTALRVQIVSTEKFGALSPREKRPTSAPMICPLARHNIDRSPLTLPPTFFFWGGGAGRGGEGSVLLENHLIKFQSP